MRFEGMLSEAWRNSAAGVTRWLLFVLLGSVAVVSVAAVDAGQAHSISTARESFDAAGGSVVVLAAESGIDGAACDSLRSVPGVVSSGAISPSQSNLELKALPGQPVPVYRVSGSFGDFSALPGLHPYSSIAIARDVAETLALSRGAVIPTSQGRMTVGDVYAWADDGRRAGLGYAVLERDPSSEPFDECWAELGPGADDDQVLLASALGANTILSSQDAGFSQLNASLGRSGPDEHAYVARPTARLPLVAFVLGGLIGFALLWPRRLETASARHAGTRDGEIALIRSAELAFSVLPLTCLTLASALVISSVSEIPALEFTWKPLITFALGAYSATLLGTLMIRERLMFKVFRSA
ncbi:hypothetical protein [Curtobacterium sp. B18]|uniref:hypothetical protein n=1 Tax=Curtobacterium sp. B18 TaxID=95614 RepID=UPI0011D1F8B7|nr:hypothetical protein [Curtobacterium sp. B18]